MLVVAHSRPHSVTRESELYWMRCVRCRRPHTEHDGQIVPGSRPLTTPRGVLGAELETWEEIRNCLSVHAYTASVMLCRKLLFHIAVSDGLAAKDSRNRAPNFAQVVSHLQTSGLVTAKMVPWVERIKEVGNEASHELPAITREQALDVATFTEQLLRLAYEMNFIMAAPELGVSVDAAIPDD